MDYDIEFLMQLDETTATKTRFDRLEDIIPLPIEVAKGFKVGRALEAGAASPDGKPKIRFTVPKGKSAASVLSETVDFSAEDKTLIVTKAEGCLCVKNGKLAVTKICEIFGDVTNKTGDIEYPASVRIHGAILEGLTVLSGGDVEVIGEVEAATIQAQGSVVLRSGLLGGEKAEVTAGKDIHLQFAQQAKVEAMGSIVVEGPLIDCDTSAFSKIVIKGNGAIVGGTARARDEINSPKIGSEGGTQTIVELGYNPFARKEVEERDEQLNRKKKELTQKEKEAGYASKELAGVLEYNPADPLSGAMYISDLTRVGKVPKMDAVKLECFRKMGSDLLSIAYLRESLARLEAGEVDAPSDPGNEKACLKVSKVAHPGVKISITGRALTLDREYEMVKFVAKDENIEPVFL